MPGAQPTHGRSFGSPILAVGFGVTVAMWTVGYLAHLPIVGAPPWVTLGGLVVCVLAGGFVFGRFAGRGFGAAAVTALVSAGVNLMVLGSLLGDREAKLPSPIVWLPGFAAAMVALFALGWSAGRGRPMARPINWRFALAMVAVAATGLLVVAGGLVTGYDAGLSVPDWPRSFQANMFLYPLSRMTGAIYYEHAHRLFGSLVGLTTIVLAIELWPARPGHRWRALLVVAVIAVVVQGLMGGLRVTYAEAGDAGVEFARPENENTISTALRVVHGVFGQMFMGLLVSLAVMVTDAYRTARQHLATIVAPADRTLGVWLIAGLLVQLALGAVLRHLDQLLLVHISFAAVVLMLAIAAGVRTWGLYGQRVEVLGRLGLWLIGAVLVQLVLGIAALVVLHDDRGPMLNVNALVTTAHQAGGAALLCLAVVQTMWCARLTSAPSPSLGQPVHPRPGGAR